MTRLDSLCRRATAAGSSRGTLAIGLLSIVIVLGMVITAIVSRESSDCTVELRSSQNRFGAPARS